MNEPIRVLCVFSDLNRGGSESMCMNIYRHIDRNKIQFDFVKHRHEKGAFEDEIITLGGKIYEAPELRPTNFFSYQSWWKKHLKVHPEHQIIHIHYYTVTFAVVGPIHSVGRVAIGHSHTAFVGNNIKSFIRYCFIRLGGRKVDYAFACSEIAGRFMYGGKPFVVLKNAIDVEKFRYNEEHRYEVRKELHIDDGALVVGTVGRFFTPKNPMGLCEIFSELHKINKEAVFLWVGDGPLYKDAEAKIEELNLTKNVIFTGVRNDIEKILQAMDVFILPSLWEGLGIVAIEAQSAGLPTLCSDSVPKEAKVTDLCEFMSLENYRFWADKILEKYESNIRRDTYCDILAAGYDIADTVRQVEEFYLRISKE